MQVIISIDTQGQVTVEAVGYKGAGCEKATAAIEKALGTPGKRTKKPEYYQGQDQRQKVGQG